MKSNTINQFCQEFNVFAKNEKRTVQVLTLKLAGFMTYFRQTSFQITSQSSRGVFNLPLKLVPPMTITQSPQVVCQPSEILLVQLSRPGWRNLVSNDFVTDFGFQLKPLP